MSSNTNSSSIQLIQKEDITHAKNQGLVFSIRIGGGAFSDVFKGTFNNINVVIKVIHHNKCRDKETYEREKYVSTLLKEKRHKNIIIFSEIFVNYNKTETWIIMEWINGKDMFQTLKDREIPFDESVAKDYFKQLVDGLKFLHSLGIVHRDIKPENIVLCKTNNTITPKYIDFGFAKTVDINDDKKAICYSHKGTLEYLAPEILSCSFKYDAIKTDIYSLGVVLFFMLFKVLPFDVNKCWDSRERIEQLLELKSNLDLHFPPAIKVSENAKELIKNLLCMDSNKRLNIDQIMASDWIRIE